MRFWSSAPIHFDHIALGALPNIAPPSSFCVLPSIDQSFMSHATALVSAKHHTRAKPASFGRFRSPRPRWFRPPAEQAKPGTGSAFAQTKGPPRGGPFASRSSKANALLRRHAHRDEQVLA